MKNRTALYALVMIFILFVGIALGMVILDAYNTIQDTNDEIKKVSADVERIESVVPANVYKALVDVSNDMREINTQLSNLELIE